MFPIRQRTVSDLCCVKYKYPNRKQNFPLPDEEIPKIGKGHVVANKPITYPLSKHDERKMLTMSQINDIRDMSLKGYVISRSKERI